MFLTMVILSGVIVSGIGIGISFLYAKGVGK
ncbi:hypothetical protein IC006_2187 [Sulfuracidifex tepidarius]|uniref:Uncharacterized protein n=1 Tax=Sulfuracidifex tepidarius TaxID=1294262 RepID=A0A510E5B9_9CREN|nr:hypothetical protein IC006_2187 [Sulfuracidifex tepidarius]BBG27637.1 hypothetical protein IC007_2191 [Sulfuracidifex tepidarius]